MADEKSPGSITQKADASDERISEVSNVSRTINRMQGKVDQEISETKFNVGDYEKIEEVQNSMIKVLNSLSQTVGSVGRGFAKVAADTAEASKDAVGQYGKAISQDINFNKQNMLAMTLARSTPIYGYFAAKFMETDVFQKAKEKMKENIAGALGGITSKFKEGMGNLFSKKASGSGKKDTELRTMKAAGAGGVPKMASGGYVERAGLAYLHPAEVVMPIEKVLEKIDDSITTTKELAAISKQAQLKTMAKMGTYVQGVEHMEKVGIFKGFIRALNDVQGRYTQPANKRMLRAVLSIQDSMGATIGTWPQVWQKMLVEHPTFRNLMFSLKSIKNIIGTPVDLVYQVFKSRGGYAGHLSKSDNPMQAAAENIGLVYSEGMWRLDNIALFTRATAEATRDLSMAITGKKYKQLEGVDSGTSSIFKRVRTAINFMGEWTPKLLGGLLGGSMGWDAGSSLGEKLTRKRRLPGQGLIDKLPGRQRMEGIYGLGGMIEGDDHKEFQKAISTHGAVPVIITKTSRQKKIENKQLQIEDKRFNAEKKYLRGIANSTDNMDDRQRRQSVFSVIGGGFSAAKSMLGGIVGFLPMILPMLTGGLFGAGTGGMISSIGTAISSKIPAIAGGIGSIITNPAVLSALTGIVSVGVAAIFGYGVGTKINEFLGITKSFEKYINARDEGDRKVASEQTKDAMARARLSSTVGGREGYTAGKLNKFQANLGQHTQARSKDVGFLGRSYILAIGSGQKEYMTKNIDKYMKYGPEQINILRGKWLAEGGFRGGAIGEDPFQYGIEREKAFHTYLYRNAKVLSIEEANRMYNDYQITFAKAHPLTAAKNYATGAAGLAKAEVMAGYNKAQETYAKGKKYLVDKATGTYRDVSKLAADEVNQLLAQGYMFTDKMEQYGQKAIATTKEAAQDVKSGIIQTSNNISTQVQNTSKVINNKASGMYSEFSEYAQRVLRGITDED